MRRSVRGARPGESPASFMFWGLVVAMIVAIAPVTFGLAKHRNWI